LIVGALEGAALGELVACATEQGLAALVEVHDERDLERALSAGATIVGVNSRNLRTLTVDLGVARRLAAPLLSAAAIGVAESGLKRREEIEDLTDLGYRAFLVGERFMTAADPGEALAAFLGGAGSGVGGGTRWGGA
jgi:indole-3-glycerol phosphate synthase